MLNLFIKSEKQNEEARHKINSSSTLNVCYFNARSICNKLNELNNLLNGVYLQSSYDVLYVNETWLNSDINNVDICGATPYNIVCTDKVSVGGGVAIFVNTLCYNEVFIPNKNDDVEVCTVDIIMNDRRKLRFAYTGRQIQEMISLCVRVTVCLTYVL